MIDVKTQSLYLTQGIFFYLYHTGKSRALKFQKIQVASINLLIKKLITTAAPFKKRRDEWVDLCDVVSVLWVGWLGVDINITVM